MIEFEGEFPKSKRRLLCPCHRQLQVAFASVANMRLGLSGVEPEGIPKHEGGVVVGGRKIAIFKDHLADNGRKGGTAPTEEELATFGAMQDIFKRVKKEGPDFLAKEYPVSERVTPYDPLRSFFDGVCLDL